MANNIDQKVNELKQFLVNNNTYEPLQKSIAMIHEADPKPKDPREFIRKYLGEPSIDLEEFASLKNNMNVLNNDVMEMKKSMLALKDDNNEMKSAISKVSEMMEKVFTQFVDCVEPKASDREPKINENMSVSPMSVSMENNVGDLDSTIMSCESTLTADQSVVDEEPIANEPESVAEMNETSSDANDTSSGATGTSNAGETICREVCTEILQKFDDFGDMGCEIDNGELHIKRQCEEQQTVTKETKMDDSFRDLSPSTVIEPLFEDPKEENIVEVPATPHTSDSADTEPNDFVDDDTDDNVKTVECIEIGEEMDFKEFDEALHTSDLTDDTPLDSSGSFASDSSNESFDVTQNEYTINVNIKLLSPIAESISESVAGEQESVEQLVKSNQPTLLKDDAETEFFLMMS